MLNLFENLNRNAVDLFVSLHTAGYGHPTVILNDDGWLPKEVTSPFSYYLGTQAKGKPRYFSKIDVPEYYEIRGTNESGGVYDEEVKRADVVFAAPSFRRFVKEVKWLGNNGAVRTIDHYNQYGRIFAQTTCDAAGNPMVKTFFDENNHEKIIQNFVTGDIILYANNRVIQFNNLTEFAVHYLIEGDFKLDRIFYNSLSYPFFITQRLADKNYKGSDVLFWQEDLGDELPGNMQAILHDDKTRTRQIIMQTAPLYQKAKQLWDNNSKVKLQLLGTIYANTGENRGTKHVLILTNSDQIVGLEELIKLLPDVKFSIGSITEMSTKLTSLDKHKNVDLYPQIVSETTKRLSDECDFLLDINQGAEILDAVRGAFEHNMIVLGFNNTLHNRHFVNQKNVFAPDQVKEMAERIKALVADKKLRDQAVIEQRLAAGNDTPDAYRKILG